MCRIYIGSLDYTLNEEDIFRVLGKIVCVDMPKEPAGARSKGFCFVEYVNKESADVVLQSVQGFILKGRSIKVGRPTVSGGLSFASNSAVTIPPRLVDCIDLYLLQRTPGMHLLTTDAAAATSLLQNRVGMKLDPNSVLSQIGHRFVLGHSCSINSTAQPSISPVVGVMATISSQNCYSFPISVYLSTSEIPGNLIPAQTPTLRNRTCIENIAASLGPNELKISNDN